MHACVYVRVYKCVGVIDTRIYKSYSTQNRSLQRTQRKRKAFHARTSLLISLFCQLHKSVNLENKKKNNLCWLAFAKWKNPRSSGKDVPSEHRARQVLPTAVRSVHRSLLLHAELPRSDSRDPNIDIFTVPLNNVAATFPRRYLPIWQSN